MENTKQTLKLLKELTEEVVVTTEKMKLSTSIPDVCKFYKELDDAIDIIENYRKAMTACKEDLVQSHLHDLITDQGFDDVKVGSHRFTPETSYYFNIPADKLEKGLDFLRSIGYDMLIKEGVNPQSLTSAMRDYVKTKGMLPPTDAITNFPKKTLSVRKAK